MERADFAYFVEGPRIIEDLKVSHPIEQEIQYEIVKTVKLAKIDYENFITDMIADRQFIEDNASLCSQGGPWRCILVQQRGRTDGVLVMPVDGCYVGWAALVNDIEQSLDEADQAADPTVARYSAEKVFDRLRKNIYEPKT
jgi:hypothetical protein